MTISDAEPTSDGRALTCIADDGRRRELSAALLWAQCPSAQGRVRRFRGLHLAPPPGLTIRAVNTIGVYGINIVFSDGHDRGIYPWPYLADLANRPQPQDFILG